MLLWFIIAYWVLSVAIGLYAARSVRNTTDYAAAGRRMPFIVVSAMVFATWFGSETVLGIPSTFAEEGMAGIVADPFGAGLCLVLFGLFFAGPLYRMNLLTIADFYRQKYGRVVETIIAVCIVISYLGWVAAQIKALGLVFNVVSGGALSQETGMMIGAGLVALYTLFGGMLAVAVTDFLQMAVIIVGLLFIAYFLGEPAGGVSNVVAHAAAAGKLEFWPAPQLVDIAVFMTALFTMMLGSIPQQDVYQRAASAKDERTARRSSVAGGLFYIAFAFVPIYIGYTAVLIAPDLVARHAEDAQQILPQLILTHAPLALQVAFFGALLSAIMSTASATLLAPSVTIAENLIRPLWKGMTDRQLLLTMRVTVLLFAVAVTAYAMSTELTIYAMVEEAYKITLAGAFVPLAFGIYWKRANPTAGLLSVVAGLSVWILMELLAPEYPLGPHVVGMLASMAGMVLGGYVFGGKAPFSRA